MANLSTVNWLPNQRVDVSDMRAIESYVGSDLRALVNMIAGPSEPFVVRGFEVLSANAATVVLNLADAMVFQPSGAVGSFYLGTANAAQLTIPLIKGATNYIQMAFKRTSQTPVTRGLWDETSPTAESPQGTQFTASVKIQNVMEPDEVSLVSTSGRVPGTAPVAIVDVDVNGNVSNIRDDRTLLFRLGRPENASYRFPWATNRQDPVQTSSSGNLASTNPSSVYYSRDAATGKVINDKGISNLKEFFDALMTSLAEIRGSSSWYAGTGSSVYLNDLNLNTAYQDSEAGHHWEPKPNSVIQWSRPDSGTGLPDYSLRSTSTDTVSWGLNYGNVRWELGGTFTTAPSTNGSLARRSFSGAGASVQFASPAVGSGLNVYLALQRDTLPTGSTGAAVTWKPSVVSPTPPSLWDTEYSIQGTTGAFTGLAIGDWVRREEEGAWAYYKVRRLLLSTGVEVGATGPSAAPTIIAGDDGAVATSAVVAIELDRAINFASVSETFKWFRSRYASGDLVVESLAQRNQTVPPYRTTSYYWLGYAWDSSGSFSGRFFTLRQYGTMSPGEEVQSLDDSDSAIDYTAGNSEVALEHAPNATYNGSSWVGSAPYLLRLTRRLTDNLIPNAGGVSNKATVQYQVAAGTIPMAAGTELWVNLQDTYSATVLVLASGNVLTTSNSYQVIASGSAPLRNFTNRDVQCIARVTDDGLLQFVNSDLLGATGLRDRNPRQIDNVVVGSSAVTPATAVVLAIGNTASAVNLRGGQVWTRRATATLMTMALANDYLISVDTNAIASSGITVILPDVSTLATNQVFVVKDRTGQAEIYPITVAGFAGELVDGASFHTLDSEYQSSTYLWNGSSFEVL